VDYVLPQAESRSRPGPSERQQIIGDDPEPHPPLHSTLAAVPATPEAMTALERADSSFTARAPAEGEAGPARSGLAGLPGEHDVPDSPLGRDPFIRGRGKTAVGDGEVRSAIEELDMPSEGRFPQDPVRLPARAHGVIGDELPLGLLDL